MTSVCVKAACAVGMEVRLLRAGCVNSCGRRAFGSLCSLTSRFAGNQTLVLFGGAAVARQTRQAVPPGCREVGSLRGSYGGCGPPRCQGPVLMRSPQGRCRSAGLREEILLRGGAAWPVPTVRSRVTDAPLSSVSPTFVVMKFDQEGNVTSFEKKKTELCQELQLQARDLRFQHSTSLTTRNNCIIIRMAALKAILTPESLLVLDFRGLGLERWLVLELAPQLASQTHSLPFEFRALEAILQHKVNTLQTRLNDVEPVILDTLEYLVDPKILSADRSKLHVLLQNSKSLSELETDIKVFKDSLLKILDEDEMIEEFCLTKWTDPRVFEESSLGIDHCEEMELLLENYFMQAEELGNKTRELKGLIDDSESVIFINLDSHRNVMMRLNLQLTMGSFSLTLFGLIGVAFGMNLTTAFEDDPRAFWLVTGFMFLGSGLIWRRLLSFLGRHLEPGVPPLIPPIWKRNTKLSDIKPGVR
ncbi:magnesium transporter MRS2 homolog, mitochondrial [Fundulus heteroclitus]|uniref:magnesium transporter MRS2 homolog, mitochondrial n=1 Tax=Fundulus heteroclitus TaxID=8078 RepID=UPI00165A64C6|nr:magnesium transporter MRS2 homolog, mitochondrial [Fundulus heteroclitus]